MVSTAVWLVGQIKGTTQALRLEIARLTATIERIESRQWDQAKQIATLEAHSHAE
jgi:hypothetical protein